MRTPVVTLDRTSFASRADLAEIISTHLDRGEIVHVVDSNWPTENQLRYTIQWTDGAGHVFDGLGRSLGIFADLDALIDHAESAMS